MEALQKKSWKSLAVVALDYTILMYAGILLDCLSSD